MLELLAPLDYPRQALANLTRGLGRAFEGEASADDYIGMLPAAFGVGAGLAGLGPLGMALSAGLGQGLGRLTGMEAFDAPTVQDTVSAIGGDPDSLIQNLGVQMATDPLTFAGVGPLFSGKLPRRAVGGFTLPEAPNPTSLQGTAVPITQAAAPAAGLAGRPPLPPDEMAALLARPIGVPERALGQASGVDPLEGLYRIHADMLEDLTPLGERLPLMQELTAAQRNWPTAPLPIPAGRAADLRAIRDDGVALDALLNWTSGKPPINVNVPGGQFVEPFAGMTVSGDATRALEHFGEPLAEFGPSMSDRVLDMLRPGPTTIMLPEEAGLTAGLLGGRGFPVNRQALGNLYTAEARYPLHSNIEWMAGARPDFDPAYDHLVSMMMQNLVGPESFGSFQQAVGQLTPQYGQLGVSQTAPLIKTLMQQMRQRSGLY